MKNTHIKIVWSQNATLHKASIEACGAKAKIFNSDIGIKKILATAKKIGKNTEKEITKILASVDHEVFIFTCINGQCDALVNFFQTTQI